MWLFADDTIAYIGKPKKINWQTIRTNKRIQQGDHIQDQCTKINTSNNQLENVIENKIQVKITTKTINNLRISLKTEFILGP